MTNKFKVILVDYDEDLFTPPEWIDEYLQSYGIEWVKGQYRSLDKVIQVSSDYDVVMIQSVRPLLTAKVIEALSRCKCIVRLGIGYDSVDIDTATENGIMVCNIPNYCVVDVADHALALLLDTTRNIAKQDRWIRSGIWDRTGARPSRRLSGSTLGFIGFGGIARALALRVGCFDMELISYDPYVEDEVFYQHEVEQVQLHDLLRRSDLITIHCALTDETHHLLSHKEFNEMKDGVCIINTSRGSIIDETALIEQVVKGKINGVGLDVFEQEPLPINSPLRKLDVVTLTPHVGANSEQSVEELYMSGCNIVIDVFNQTWPKNVINPEVRSCRQFRLS
jgi:D-3-phosphoglycerate dehydrogenase